MAFSPGLFMVQTSLYSLIVALVVETLIRIWHLREPELRLRFRLLVLILPLICWPLYNLLYPWLMGVGSQRVLLLDTKQWLELEVWKGFPFWYLLALVAAPVTVLFLVQELWPVRHHFFPRPFRQGAKEMPKLDSALGELAKAAALSPPRVLLVEHREPIAYATGAGHGSLVLSSSLVDILDHGELRGVLAHELSHLIRRDPQRGWGVMLLRAIMFYNPVALLAFRRLIHENEKACDDLAVRLTQRPLDLASSLVKVFRASSHPRRLPGERGRLSSYLDALDHHAHKIMVEERIKRILRPEVRPNHYGNLRLGLTIGSLLVLLFLVA